MLDERHKNSTGAVGHPVALLPTLHGAQRQIERRGELFLRHAEALANRLNIRTGNDAKRTEGRIIHAVVALLSLGLEGY
jgi:hypothetical protein